MAVKKDVAAYDELMPALVIANRCLGYVNAPSLFQMVVADCLDVKADVAFYDRNRKLLYQELTRIGFECVRPDGAFYLLVKAPDGDGAAFAKAAEKHNIVVVPTDGFGCPGYVRLAYCVPHAMIERSIPAFEALAEDLRL